MFRRYNADLYSLSAVDVRFEPSMDGYYKFRKNIPNVTERNSGLYTCVAANRGKFLLNTLKYTCCLYFNRFTTILRLNRILYLCLGIY